MKIEKNRKRNRLENFDYSQNGMYFVTICTKNREDFFGEIKNGRMILNKAGEIAENVWKELPKHYENIEIDCFSIMPNHIHGIINIVDVDMVGTGSRAVGTGLKPVPTKGHSLSEIIRGFKTFSARFINKRENILERPVWQRSFYDRIIRNETELNKIREYIIKNPESWETDRNNSINIK